MRVEVIEPRSSARLRDAVRELWHARDLVLILARRDLAVRYKQALFGFLWAIAQPVALAVTFAVFLRRHAGGPTGAEYVTYALAGLAPWTFFANAVSIASESLVGSSNLVSKVYFPRLAVPLAALLSWLPDVAITTVVVAATAVVTGVGVEWTVVVAPAFLAFTALAALGVVMWTSSLNVAYRDIKYAVPFMVQLWLFATPAIYSTTVGAPGDSALFGLNPMIGAVNGFRWAFFGGAFPSSQLAVSALVVALLLSTGFAYFRRVERYFADVI